MKDRVNFDYVHPIESAKKTMDLLSKYPQFRKEAELIVKDLSSECPRINQIICSHFGPQYRYGPQYTEMGFCTLAFADIIEPYHDNKDIGICATEFYVALDILDDILDTGECDSLRERYLFEKSRQIFSGDLVRSDEPEICAMQAIVKDMRTRIQLFSREDAIDSFTFQCMKLFDVMAGETRSQSQLRSIVTAVNVGRKCAYPLMELIRCKYGTTLPLNIAGNLVGIGNIMDDYWDVIKDAKVKKETFLTKSLSDAEISNIQIIAKVVGNLDAHRLALEYSRRLFLRVVSQTEPEFFDDILAIALFAQVGVFKRRYHSILRKIHQE